MGSALPEWTVGRPNAMSGGRADRKGATLVEVMIASVVLVVMALGGAAFLFRSRGDVAVQRNKRAALEVANSRLEDLQASSYDDIKPLNQDYTSYYISRVGANWALASADPGETVLINNRLYPIAATVVYLDVDGGGPSYDCVQATVSVGYRLGSGDAVRLQTFLAP